MPLDCQHSLSAARGQTSHQNTRRNTLLGQKSCKLLEIQSLTQAKIPCLTWGLSNNQNSHPQLKQRKPSIQSQPTPTRRLEMKQKPRKERLIQQGQTEKCLPSCILPEHQISRIQCKNTIKVRQGNMTRPQFLWYKKPQIFQHSWGARKGP